jgi:hypothetical protein
MRGCDNSKIYISSKFILSICLLIMFITLQHLATLNHTTPTYTSLHLSTFHFLSFTLHYSPIWLNPSTSPIVLSYHITKLDTVRLSHPQTFSKVMNPFTILKNFSPFQIFILFYYFSFFLSSGHKFTLLFASTNHFPSLPLPSLFAFNRLHFPHCFALS